MSVKEIIMLTAIKGYYDNGKIVLQENAPVQTKTAVIITFLTDDIEKPKGQRIPGGLKGKIVIADDFNEPLEISSFSN